MRPLPDLEWNFDGPQDAAAYRGEVARLWGMWLVGLVAILLADNWIIWVGGIAALAAMLFLARPLQARAAAIVPDDDAPDPTVSAAFRRSRRDRVLRELAYGEEPLKASGAGAPWLWARRVVVAATFAAFAFVLYDLFVGVQ